MSSLQLYPVANTLEIEQTGSGATQATGAVNASATVSEQGGFASKNTSIVTGFPSENNPSKVTSNEPLPDKGAVVEDSGYTFPFIDNPPDIGESV